MLLRLLLKLLPSAVDFLEVQVDALAFVLLGFGWTRAGLENFNSGGLGLRRICGFVLVLVLGLGLGLGHRWLLLLERTFRLLDVGCFLPLSRFGTGVDRRQVLR